MKNRANVVHATNTALLSQLCCQVTPVFFLIIFFRTINAKKQSTDYFTSHFIREQGNSKRKGKTKQSLHTTKFLVSCTGKYDRITPVLKELHWLPVKQRIIFKIVLFTYKALKALASQYISDFLVQYKPPRALRSSDKTLLQVPHFKLKTYRGRSFSYMYIAPYLWNQLPDAIRQAPSLATFKSNLKTYLFDQVFN